ncbi:MAG: alpha/beta hydrolase [Acetobacteraceae bacterium]
MRLEDYPPQEPLSEAGQRYAAECWRRGEGVAAEEHAYGPDPYQRLLVMPAPNPTGEVLLFWHGGGWTSGYKEWMAFMAPAFTAAGVTFVSAGYRLAPQHLFPAGFEDCAAALAWVHGACARFGGDPAWLFVGGHSAGGHYAALLATRFDWQAARGLPQEVIRGALPISGVYRFGDGSGLSARPRFLGPEGNERAASPLLWLDAPPRPMLVAWGSQDVPHQVMQAEAFADAAAAAGGRIRRLVLPGATHFTASFAGGEADGPWVPEALAFLRAA